MNKTKLTQGLNMALELLEGTHPHPPLNKIKEHQQAIEALEAIRGWAADAVAQINTLQEEITRTHQLLDEVGVGHPEWDLSSRVVLMSFWMKNTPANARLLAALEVVEPHFTKITENLNQQVSQHGYDEGYDAEQAQWLNYVTNELQTLAKWQSPPPDVPQKALVKIRVTGPVRILECPDWIKIELVGKKN
ncbi:MAG: hypothetical protein ACPGWR_02480 [Ardenticatenaceae bacterium]